MNPNTQQQNTQGGNSHLKATNQMAGNMAFVNTLQEHLLQHHGAKNAPQKTSQEPKTTQEQEKPKDQGKSPQDENKPNIGEELTKFKTEIEGLIDSKLGDLKREIETALAEPDETNEPQKPQ